MKDSICNNKKSKKNYKNKRKNSKNSKTLNKNILKFLKIFRSNKKRLLMNLKIYSIIINYHDQTKQTA